MISQAGMAASEPARRAEIIYAQARSQLDVRLWRAALGSELPSNAATPVAGRPPLALATLLELSAASHDTSVSLVRPLPGGRPLAINEPADAVPAKATPVSTGRGFGNNAGYSGQVTDAAGRVGMPAAALASIIDAEAAKNRDGSWRTSSRNSRSTATGLGQFLSGTWKAEAERAGTWLNAAARRNGWIGSDGCVLPDARAALLELRGDAEASINATADYARHSLDTLARAGVAIGSTVDQIAHAAYLGHNLGVGDAIRYLRGGLDERRAGQLLNAQVGSVAAARRIAQAGGASAAHRTWLSEFMARHVDASRFSGQAV